MLFPLYVGVTPADLRRAATSSPTSTTAPACGPEAGTSRFFIFPLWESAVKRPGDYMWEVLLGLFGYERIGRNRYLKLFFFPFELRARPRRPDRLVRQAGQAQPARTPLRPGHPDLVAAAPPPADVRSRRRISPGA